VGPIWRQLGVVMVATAAIGAANAWRNVDTALASRAVTLTNCAWAATDRNAPQPVTRSQDAGSFGNNAGGVTRRISDRLFVGKALDANAGNNEFGPIASFGDWLSLHFGPYTVGPSQFVTLTTPGANIAVLGGARTNDTAEPAGGYTFGSAAIGINDNLVTSTNMTTLYSETWSWANTGHTLGHESDLININNPNPARISPYSIVGNGHDQLLANHWLSSGRSDILSVSIGGTVTAGDIVSLSFAGGYGGSLQTVSYTVRSGDTTTTIAEGLVTAIRANATLLNSNHFYAKNVGAVIAILGFDIPGTKFSAKISGAVTETVSFGRPGNASVAIGILNNNTLPYDEHAGAFKSGIVFDRYTLEGSDGSDAAKCCAEAIALAREQSISFYNSGDRPGHPQARIYSEATSASGFAQSLAFGNLGMVADVPSFIVHSAADSTLVATSRQSSGSGMSIASLDNALTTVEPLQLQGKPLRLIGLDSLPMIGRFSVDSSGNTSTAGLDIMGHFVAHGSDVSIAAGFGMSPSLVGNSVAGRVTVGRGGAASGVLDFKVPFSTHAPVCFAQDETRSSHLRATATTRTLTVTGGMAESDSITYYCVGLL
jgi:hypothetical protein